VARYTVMRLLIFFGCLVAFWLVFYLLHIERQEFAMVAGAALVSAALSWFVLKEPREQMSRTLEGKVEARRQRRAQDDVAEDVEDASS